MCLQGKIFWARTEGLGFSIATFTVTAALSIALLLARRRYEFFGRAELGGPCCSRYLSAAILISLWLIYLFLSLRDLVI